MKLTYLLTCFALVPQNINGASLPKLNRAIDLQREHAHDLQRSALVVAPDYTLERRKGGAAGGAGAGRGGGSGGRGGGSGGRGGGSISSSSGGRSGGGRTSTLSNFGGYTRIGSGPSRIYGQGSYYGGGATVPYQAGNKTPKGLVAGALLASAALLALMPGRWLWGVYPYHYSTPYHFYNRTATNETRNDATKPKRQVAGGVNQTLPVICLCQEFSVCGCDENTDQAYIDDLVGNGSYAALNKSLVTVSDVNGTRTLVLNGTLPNGTTAPGPEGAAASLSIGKYSGYWLIGLIVVYGVFV